MKTILPDPDDGKATASDEVRARPSLFLFTSVKNCTPIHIMAETQEIGTKSVIQLLKDAITNIFI